MAFETLNVNRMVAIELYGKRNQQRIMENQQPDKKNEETWDTGQQDFKEGRLVSEETDNVDASGVDDHSTGMGEDDFLGKTNLEGKDDE